MIFYRRKFVIMPERTKDCCDVVIYKLVDDNYSNYNLIAALKVIMMTLDAAIYNHASDGFIAVFDLEKVTQNFKFLKNKKIIIIFQMGLMHLTKMKISTLTKTFHYLQEALPVKLKEIHIINVSSIVEKIMTMLKPLLKENLFKMVSLTIIYGLTIC